MNIEALAAALEEVLIVGTSLGRFEGFCDSWRHYQWADEEDRLIGILSQETWYFSDEAGFVKLCSRPELIDSRLADLAGFARKPPCDREGPSIRHSPQMWIAAGEQAGQYARALNSLDLLTQMRDWAPP